MKFIIEPHRPKYIKNPWATESKKQPVPSVDEVIYNHNVQQMKESRIHPHGFRDLLKEITLVNNPIWVTF